MWEALFKRYWLVTILKESPANTPYSPVIMVFAAFWFFMVIIFQWYLADIKQQFTFANSILAALTLLCSYFIYTFLILKINRKVNRALQTLTCLLVSHTIIHFFAFPLLLAAPLLAKANLAQAVLVSIGMVYILLTLSLTLWQFIVTIYIYKKSLDLDSLAATLAGFGLLACNFLTVSFWH